MSDNNLISRMDLYEKTAEWEAEALRMVELHLRDDDKAEWRKWSTVLAERSAFKHDVADAPAVPQEMSARELYSTYQRICKEYNPPKEYNPKRNVRCDECPLYHHCPRISQALRMVMACSPRIEKWAREHPEERSKDE